MFSIVAEMYCVVCVVAYIRLLVLRICFCFFIIKKERSLSSEMRWDITYFINNKKIRHSVILALLSYYIRRTTAKKETHQVITNAHTTAHFFKYHLMAGIGACSFNSAGCSSRVPNSFTPSTNDLPWVNWFNISNDT